METYNTQAVSQENGEMLTHPVANQDVESNDSYSGRYREPNNFDTEEFDNLGGLHYMNYLHANDDML